MVLPGSCNKEEGRCRALVQQQTVWKEMGCVSVSHQRDRVLSTVCPAIDPVVAAHLIKEYPSEC